MRMEYVNNLKKLFDIYNIDGYIIPSTDEFMSEYVPDFAKRLEYITGFSGSNGTCIILKNQGLFFTDGRYLEQSKHQLDQDFFKIFDIKDIASFPYNEYIQNHYNIGYDSKLFTNQTLKFFNQLKLTSIKENLIDKIWNDQPSRPNSKIYIYSDEYAGQSYVEKIELCKKAISKHSGKALVITAPDSVCWLLNLRASDVEFSPLMLAPVVITPEKTYLFVDPSRINKALELSRSLISFIPLAQFEEFLQNIDGKVLVDESSSSIFIINSLKNKEAIIDPCKLPKACKNDIEIKHAIDGHIKDGVAVCEFLSWLENTDLTSFSEYDLGEKLTSFRSQQSGYMSDSFPAICGFKENGAIIHYRAWTETAKKIKEDGLLLIDSGGQYLGATTDITRTVVIGEPTAQEKNCYTYILQGHIELAQAKFPLGVNGANLEVLARKFLWQKNLDYPHSTGHGVGNYLSVHEGPQSINLRNTVPLSVGMILSNEPGYYLPGKFGIRIENLMYVKKSEHPDYLQFEALTLVPYAKELIDLDILSKSEIEYLQQYYQKIRELLYHLLSSDAQKWLDSQITI